MIANIDINNKWADAAGPGGWNDPDMLEVGNGGMTLHEYRTHFALWCISKSPLIIGNDIRYMEKTVLDILTAPRLIAVNQDKLGKQAKIVRQTSSGESMVQLRPCSGSLEGQQWIEDEQGRLQAAESRSPVPRFVFPWLMFLHLQLFGHTLT
jgi:alpha-galactosidase